MTARETAVAAETIQCEYCDSSNVEKLPRGVKLCLDCKQSWGGGGTKRFRPAPSHIRNQDAAPLEPIERFRTQRGQWMTLADDHLYARYYDTVRGVRKKVMTRLADAGTFKDFTHSKAQKEAAKRGQCDCGNCALLEKHMETVNACQRKDWSPSAKLELTVGDVFTNSYMPAVRNMEMSRSTLVAYESNWKRYIAEYIADIPIRSFESGHASDFLKSLANRKVKGGKKGLNSSSTALCRAVARNIFTYARSEKIYHGVNPFDDLQIFGVKVRPKGVTVAYSPEETVAILNAIPARDNAARLFWLLCSVFALRPSEAAGCQWEDIDWKADEGVTLHVQRAVSKGHIQDAMKTHSSDRFELLSSSVKVMDVLNKYKEQCSGRGWLFKKRTGAPVNSEEFPKRRIAPHAIKVVGDRWHGCYAGRRGAITAHRILTGDSNSAAVTAGHKNTRTTDQHYVKMPNAVAFAGQKKVGAEFDKL